MIWAWRAVPRCAAGTVLLASMAVLVGCAAPGDAARPAGGEAQLQSQPLLALAPAALGCAASVQQRLTVRPPHQQAQELEALLEVDAQAVRLAIFHMGQRMGTVVWDGVQLDAQLSRWWPAQLKPAQVLSDMQLALWPASAVQQGLPALWSLEASAQGRRLLQAGQERVLARGASR